MVVSGLHITYVCVLYDKVSQLVPACLDSITSWRLRTLLTQKLFQETALESSSMSAVIVCNYGQCPHHVNGTNGSSGCQHDITDQQLVSTNIKAESWKATLGQTNNDVSIQPHPTTPNPLHDQPSKVMTLARPA